MMDYLAWFLARLADFQRLIEYFGIAAIFVWLYLLERGDRVRRDEGEQAQKNIGIITKHYQTSWVFFGIAVLAEYALSEESLTRVFGTFALSSVNYIAIIFGLVMFALPSYLMYGKTSGHKSYADMSVPEVGQVLFAVMAGLTHAVLLWGIFALPLLNTPNQILAITFGLSYFGICATLTKWGNIKGWHTRLVMILIFLPWITLFTMIALALLN